MKNAITTLTVAVVSVATIMLATLTATAAPRTFTLAADPAYVPEDVVDVRGDIIIALDKEGVSAEEIDEVLAAMDDVERIDETLISPAHICDFACGRPCPVRWRYVHILVDVVQNWRRERLAQGHTLCGELYTCVYRALIERRTFLNVCVCAAGPTFPYETWGCFWYSGMSTVRDCTRPRCYSLSPVDDVTAERIDAVPARP